MKRLLYILLLLLPFTLFSQWEELNIELSDVPLKIVTSQYTDSLVAVVLWDSVFLSTDSGSTWRLINSDVNNGYTDLRFLPDGIVFSKWDTLYITSDLGKSYDKIKLPEFVITEFSLLDSFISVSTPFFTLMKSTDRGITWQTITKYTDENYDRECHESGSPHCSSILTSGIFMGIDGNNVFYNLNRVEYREGMAVSTIDKGLHKSWNFGENWMALGITGVSNISFAWPVIFASTNNGFFRSDDYGNKWNLKNPENFLSYTIVRKNIIGIGETKIFISDDSGETWQDYEKELDYSANSEFTFNQTYMYATVGCKIFRKRLTDYPLGIELFTNNNEPLLFPNPVKGIITIIEPGVESVEIINLEGITILKLNSNFNEVDVSALKKGIYLVKVRFISGEVCTQKMVKE